MPGIWDGATIPGGDLKGVTVGSCIGPGGCIYLYYTFTGPKITQILLRIAYPVPSMYAIFAYIYCQFCYLLAPVSSNTPEQKIRRLQTVQTEGEQHPESNCAYIP